MSCLAVFPFDAPVERLYDLKGSTAGRAATQEEKASDFCILKVTIMAEDDAHMIEAGYKFFRPRQTEFYLIK